MNRLQARIVSTSLVLLLTLVAWAGAEQPAVLKEMPDDAQFVLATRPLTALSAKADVFARQIGLPVQPEQPVDLGNMLGAKLQMPGMVDGTRGLGLIATDLTQFEQTMIGFIPIRSERDLVDALKAQQAVLVPEQSDIWQLPGQPASYLMVKNDYAVLGSQVAQLESVKSASGISFEGYDSTLFGSADVAATIKMTAVAPLIQTAAAAAIAEEESLKDAPAVPMIANMAVARVTEIERLSLGALIGTKGLHTRMGVKALEGSKLAEYLVAEKKAGPEMLSKLPGGSFIGAYVFSLDSKMLVDPVTAVLDKLIANPSVGEETMLDTNNLMELRKQVVDIYSMMGTGVEALYVPPAPAQPADPAAAAQAMAPRMMGLSYMENGQSMMDKLPGMTKPLNTLFKQVGFDLALAIKEDAGKASGVSYDEFQIDMSNLEMTETETAQMKAMWGEDGTMSYQIATLKDDLFAFGMGDGCMDAVVELAQNKGAGTLDQNADIKATASQLPGQANVYTFINAGNYISWIMSIAESQDPSVAMLGSMFGNIKGVVGAACTLEDNMLKMDGYIPNELIQGGMQTAMMMMMGMGGGAGMGGPGGPGMMPPGGGMPPQQPQRQPQQQDSF